MLPSSYSATTVFLIIISTYLLLITVQCLGQVPQFNYSHPRLWGRINPKYAQCSKGRNQSPIDINPNHVFVNKTMRPLTRSYHVYNATLATDGIEVQVVFNEKGSLMIDGKSYQLKQMHWHAPSEHRLNGVQYAAELHQVHAAADGSRTVVATLLKNGLPNRVLAMLKPQLNELAKNPCRNHNQQISIPKFESFLVRRRSRKYYRYYGSLTTPPCDEDVIWNVFTKVKTISKEQIDALNAPLCAPNKFKNDRPIQPLDGRTIQKYDGN